MKTATSHWRHVKERLKVYTIDNYPRQYASCQEDLAITFSMLADTEVSIEAKKFDLKRAIEACEEAIGIYASLDLAHAQANDYAIESAEIQMLLWAAYSGLADVEDKAKNSKRAIEACMAALQIYEQRSQADHADANKNLGYSYITLAEVEESAQNCQKAIDAYMSSLVFYTVETAPMEHADILKIWPMPTSLCPRQKTGKSAARGL